MAKITTVYMMIKGEMQPFSMKEYLAMREDDARIRGLKFIPIDSRMYEATPEQFKEWQKERDERRNEKNARRKPIRLNINSHIRVFPIRTRIYLKLSLLTTLVMLRKRHWIISWANYCACP